ncbi:hypothetical protein BX666DRAFT_942337 [Dichotomocladium elegans]|nr:hypothetical protein BX666DRAFT_942337 [Dichotomocladium elegans]
MEAMQKNDGVEQLAAEFSGLSISHTASPDTINDTNPTRQRTDDPLSLTSTSNRYPTCEKKKKDIQDAAHLQLSQPPNQAPLARGSNENAASLPASGEYPTVDTGLRKDTVSDKRGSRVQSQVLSGMVTAADVPSEQSPAGSKAELASCCSICKRELKENIAHTIEKGTIVCRDCFERPKEEEIGVRKQCMNCKKVDLTRTRKRNGEYRCTNCKSFFDRNGYERPESIYAKGTMEGYANLECHHCHLHQTKHNFTGYWYPAGDGKNYICQNCRRYLKISLYSLLKFRPFEGRFTLNHHPDAASRDFTLLGRLLLALKNHLPPL